MWRPRYAWHRAQSSDEIPYGIWCTVLMRYPDCIPRLYWLAALICCTYTLIHSCTHAHMHTYTHTLIHACTHAHMHTCTHAHMHTCAHAHMHTCTHAHIHTCTHAHMHTRTHAHIHTCTHAHMHTSNVTCVTDTRVRWSCLCLICMCSRYWHNGVSKAICMPYVYIPLYIGGVFMPYMYV